jgi:23S rRNA (adenine2503-C2)-methyltransferase
MPKNIYDFSLPVLSSLLVDWGHPPYRARQIWEGLYRSFWNSPHQFSNLPSSLRDQLAKEMQFPLLAPVTTMQSSDGQTVKTLFHLHDGKAIEAVLMRYKKRNSLCISTQVGCAMGCVFCATGQMGFKRNLASGEIVAQVIHYARLLKVEGEVVTNVVLMGMGEPFHNYQNTMSAIDRLNDSGGFNLGARRFTLSTVGLIPSIRQFTSEKRQVNLAISLHTVDDALRSSMLPVNKRFPINELLEACREYVSVTGRRITFEWALINGLNDTPEQAHLLAKRLKNLICHVNAIPLNPTRNFAGKPASHTTAILFKSVLESLGIPCTIRLRRGMDIEAGCGQLMVK